MRIKYFLFGAAALALGACSSEESENVAPSKGEAYVQFTVKLPTASATRSETDASGETAEGEEVGKDRENQITSVQVILDDGAGNVAKSVVFNTASGAKLPAAGTDTYTTDPIKVDGLVGGKTYKAYAIVNGELPTGKTVESAPITVTAVDLTSGIAKDDNFLMTGTGGTVPTDADVTKYTKDYPLDCGIIEVERAAARFDYKAIKTGNVYEVLAPTSGAHAGQKVTVTLTDMALTNVSKDFYLFKRVSDDGTNAGWTLGGAEKGSLSVLADNNYVVDYNYAAKTKALWSSFVPANNYFNVYAGTAAATYKPLKTTVGTDEQDNDWTGTTVPGYFIQTYCTENTIQAEPTENQINGLSTGVIFKGEIGGNFKEYDDGDDLTPIGTDLAFNTTDPAYVLNGVVYGKWAAVVAAKGKGDAAVLNAFSIGGLDETDPTTLTAVNLAKAGFTRYTPQGGKYYTYYVYWNQHNNNGKSNVMGPMEFAVVRNNVYKLAVTEIAKLGHPKDPTNPDPTPGDPTDDDPDPDEPDPTNPDEDSNLYLKVSVKVLPWTVRKNDIKF